MQPQPILENQSELIEAMKKGNTEAFEALLLFYEKAIFAFIYRLVQHRENAEDLTQETFIKVYKNRKSVDETKNFKAWLYRIATNTVYDWFRSQKNKRELLILDDPDTPIETIDTKEPYYVLERNEDLERALALIKPIYKSALLLFYLEGLQYDEIAMALNVPQNTVKTYLYRGKQELQKYLSDVAKRQSPNS